MLNNKDSAANSTTVSSNPFHSPLEQNAEVGVGLPLKRLFCEIQGQTDSTSSVASSIPFKSSTGRTVDLTDKPVMKKLLF